MEWYEMGGLTFILIVFLASVVVIVMRWFRHRERLAMIDRGLVPPDASVRVQVAGRKKGRGLLIGGIGLAALGLALLCAALFLALPMLTGLSSPMGLSSLGFAHLPGLLVLFMGIALLIVHLITLPAGDAEPRVDAPPEVPEGSEGEVPPGPELDPFADASSEEFEAKAASNE